MRLIVATVALPAALAASGTVPGADAAASVLTPLVALAWAWKGGAKACALALLPGVAVLAWLASAGLGAAGIGGYLAAGVAGGMFAGLLARGRRVGLSLVIASVPFAIWTAGLWATGYDPVTPELEQAWDRVLAEAGGGEEIQASAERALGIARRTWVSSEILGFTSMLALAFWFVRRWPEGATLPTPGRIAQLDLPDAVVAPMILGLVLVLLGDGWPASVGWNLVTLTGAAYVVRGLAIEAFWMDRGRIGRGARTLFFAGNVLLFLPVFLTLTAAIGLFDTWFDFRRRRGSEGGGHPLSLFHDRSGDDLKE